MNTQAPIDTFLNKRRKDDSCGVDDDDNNYNKKY